MTRERHETLPSAYETARSIEDDDADRLRANHHKRLPTCQFDDLDTVRRDARAQRTGPLDSLRHELLGPVGHTQRYPIQQKETIVTSTESRC